MIQSNLFKDVVLLGLGCGLNDPREWIRNYDLSLMNICVYEDIPDVQQELYKVAKELYQSIHMEEDVADEIVHKWVWERK